MVDAILQLTWVGSGSDPAEEYILNLSQCLLGASSLESKRALHAMIFVL